MPTAPPHPCNYPGCNALTTQPYCDEHKGAYDRARAGDPFRKVYCSKRWRTLREQKLRENPLCERCLPHVVYATDVHHRKEMRDGGEMFPPLSGLESLCHRCHSRHGASEGKRWAHA